MAKVTTEDVRDVINITTAEIPDEKIQKMIKRAETTLALELSKEIDYTDCIAAERITKNTDIQLRQTSAKNLL